MTFPVGFGIVTNPSQVSRIAQFATGGNKDTAEVPRPDILWPYWEREDQN